MDERVTWDEYFMGIAQFIAKRSNDKSTQVGACIVDSLNRIIGTGYNGMPRNCDNEKMPWAREGDYLETKYPYIVHAELNAILNSQNVSLRGCKVYVSLFPCNECAKAIVQAGIKEVVYLSDKYGDKEEFKAAKRLFDFAGVKYSQYKPTGRTIMLNI